MFRITNMCIRIEKRSRCYNIHSAYKQIYPIYYKLSSLKPRVYIFATLKWLLARRLCGNHCQNNFTMVQLNFDMTNCIVIRESMFGKTDIPSILHAPGLVIWAEILFILSKCWLKNCHKINGYKLIIESNCSSFSKRYLLIGSHPWLSVYTIINRWKSLFFQ